MGLGPGTVRRRYARHSQFRERRQAPHQRRQRRITRRNAGRTRAAGASRIVKLSIENRAALLQAMVETAREAGVVILRHYAGTVEGRQKADKSPVTDAD